jgi:hypothetical protein
MCGIFGGIGTNLNIGIIRALALANRERGTDSYGLFDSNGETIKSAKDPIDCLADSQFDHFTREACWRGWFIAGHTRYATTGRIIAKNAHPFKFGNIVGSHNGMVEHPRNRGYSVDSEYLFDQLNRHRGDYQAAFADVEGYWGLAWFDGHYFYLQAHGNEIAVAHAADGNIYYSSDPLHLAACIGPTDQLVVLSDGATLRFEAGNPNFEALADFKSNAKRKWNREATASQGGNKKSKKAKRKESAASRDGYGPIAASRYTDYADYLGHDEYLWANELAEDFGYGSFKDFMEETGYASEHAALAFLERHIEGSVKTPAYDDWRMDDRNNAWADSDERLGLGSIPF